MPCDPFPSQRFILTTPQNFTKNPSKPRDHEPRLQVPTVRVFASNKFPRGKSVPDKKKLQFHLKKEMFFAREVVLRSADLNIKYFERKFNESSRLSSVSCEGQV